MTKINKDFFKGMNPNKRTPDQIEQDILRIEEMTNETTDRIDQEETKKEEEIVIIEKQSVAYHKLKASDLPMFRIYKGFQYEWYFKLEVIDGKQVCIKIMIDENEIIMRPAKASEILDEENQPCTREDWMLATAKVLNYMSPNIVKS